MNWQVFSSRCETKIFPALYLTGMKSVVVSDRAKYRTVLDDEDKYAVTPWNKNCICTAISRWCGTPDHWVLFWKKRKMKSDFISYARSIYSSTQYKIQKIANKFQINDFGINFLFL